jgi:hypothetical protein
MPSHNGGVSALYGANPEDMESEAEHREVPTEDAAVKSLGTMKKEHRGWHQATG